MSIHRIVVQSLFSLSRFRNSRKLPKASVFAICIVIFFSGSANAQGTRLLRQPSISENSVAFVYGGDIWVSVLGRSNAVRITSTAAVESDPHFSPDGNSIAFTSNRTGTASVYVVPTEGGTPTRLTWHPSPVQTRGWTTDGTQVLYSTGRETAPTPHNRLWTVSVEGSAPTLLARQWGNNGSFSADGNQIVIDRVTRWDEEWRAYRGGQNTPLVILDLNDLSETFIPNESTTDIEPIWVGDTIYFLSDRSWTSNVWAYTPANGSLRQVTDYEDIDIKQLAGNSQRLVFERDGFLHTLDPQSGEAEQLEINVRGDFPWAEVKWEDVSEDVQSTSLSPTGKRAILSVRGEVFTVPVENGNSRNITESSDAADRAPLWSPLGDQIAWFSDEGGSGYELLIGDQDGLSLNDRIAIGESKMAWEPAWSPDGELIAFVDDDVRFRVIDLASKTISTIDVGGTNLERGVTGLNWSPDSNWLAYSKTGANGFRQIMVWSREDDGVRGMTNPLADAFSPTWDRDREHFYFLASTDVALGTGWANTSAMNSRPVYGAYIINLTEEGDSPFRPRSDEEAKPEEALDEQADSEEESSSAEEESEPVIAISFDDIERRTMAMPIPTRNYPMMVSGPAGTVFVGEQMPNSRNMRLHKFSLEDRESKQFVENVSDVSVSADANKMLLKQGDNWQLADTTGADASGGEAVAINLRMRLDREAEWKQIFNETWRYERDYFYDPGLHGRDWDDVYDRYSPLVPYIRHRSDLTYVLDQVNGELSVGHSFVRGGDLPEVEESTTGLLGADFVAEQNRWQIGRIYTSESWNPDLTGPLDQPGLNIEEGHYLVGVNGRELFAGDNPYEFLDGTAGQQTVLHINSSPSFQDAWQETVVPIRSENTLRQRTWVEDNRRRVDELSDGKLAYIWVPNTSNPGLVSFNRYFFGQQDKQGAVIDERFNGGGLLDDYMVDVMARSLRAGITNEVPNGEAIRLPAGILGPKVLLVNEMAGSGGDFFPWIFRQQEIGPLIGSTTWGGLVKSSVHYQLVDGGTVTAPDNAVFDPANGQWVAENIGIAPDYEVFQDAQSLENGEDPQLQRAVSEALNMLTELGEIRISSPSFPTPAIQ